jgi:outer membrane lipoprotein-sorting protein
MRSLPRRARWAVPVGAVAAVGLVIAGSALVGAQAAPRLPARSTAQLLAAVDAPSARLPAMTAVVQETASLGLPNLPGSSDSLSPMSLLSGTHTFTIWYDGPTRVRIAMPVTLGETDLRRDGRDVWLWNSRTSQATHYVLPAGSASMPDQSTPAPDTAAPDTAAPDTAAPDAPTPQQVARQILAAVGATTTVGLQPDVTVAGQAAYQLSLAPKDSRSLIGQVRIAIDARDALPLRVQIFARGASGPALQVGYTSLSFGRPAASNFAFTAPPGAKVKTITVPAGAGFPGARPGLPFLGMPARAPGSSGGTCVGMSRATLKQISSSLAAQLPKDMPKARRAAVLKSLATSQPSPGDLHCAWISAVPAGYGWHASPASSAVPVPALMSVPTVMGKDWLSVLVLPAGGLSASGLPAVPSSGSGASVTFSSGAASGGPNIAVSGVGAALLGAARPVHGSWGSGRLLRTSLVSVLITSSGQVLIGAVQPSVLYADAAQLR